MLEQLTQVGGCGDVFIGVANAEGTIALRFSGAPLAEIAHQMASQQVRESVLPSEDVLTLDIETGKYLGDFCNDAVEMSPEVAHTWSAVSGTVKLTVDPTGEGGFEWPADADLELTDVTFEGAGLVSATIDSWLVEDVHVGWYPG